MKPSINLRYRSLLLTCLLILAAGAAAPAQIERIEYKSGKRQVVSERVDTVYFQKGKEKQLFIPELRNNNGGSDENYRWYVRWYRFDENGNLTNKGITGKDINPMTDGSYVNGGSLDDRLYKTSLRKIDTSLFWYKGFFNGTSDFATGASTVVYDMDVVAEDSVFCDVSLNADDYKISADGKTFTEPELSVRYKFIIRPASEIAERIRTSGANEIDKPFIEENLYVSEDARNVNVQIGMAANNYAWYTDAGLIVGEKYKYAIDGTTVKELNRWKTMVDSLSFTKDTTELTIWAVDSLNNRSPLIYRYNIIKQKGAGFMLQDDPERSKYPARNPDDNQELYELIGYINFDRKDSITIEELKDNPLRNISNIGFPTEEDTVGYWLERDMTGYAPYNYVSQKAYGKWGGKPRFQTLQNQYGLFRTANVQGISKQGKDFYDGRQNFWFFANSGVTKEVYDRTYYNTKGEKLGYFYYVDAANLPGRLVKIPLDHGTICANTGLLVNFWVNDMTGKGTANLPPNINMFFIGRKEDGKEDILHRFTSGDAIDGDDCLGEWQQLVYTFTLVQNISVYKEFYLEVQNNTIHANGADYAIDGLRIYRTIPKIDVKRVDVCSSANLTVATDYELLLKNMGWSIQPDALATIKDKMKDGVTEDSKHIWKYRYGLMGGDPEKRKENLNETIGNVYVGATDKKETGNIGKPEDWITLNTDLKDYKNENYNNRSKVYRIIVPTKDGLKHQGFKDLTNYETAMRRQIVVNLRMINDFLYDADKGKVWEKEITDHAQKTNGDPFPKDEYIAYLKQNLGELCGKSESEWDYKIPEPKDLSNQIDRIMEGNDNNLYEELIRAVCSVMGISRPRVPWWNEGNNNTIHLSAIDVNKTELRYKGEKPYGSGTEVEPASGKYDVVIFSAAATTGTSDVVEFPNAYAGSSFKDPCLLTTPFTVLPSFTVVAKTKTDLPEGMIACEGRISQIEEATMWVEKYDENNNLMTGETDKFVDRYEGYSYTFDWFLGDSLEFAAFSDEYGIPLEEILKSYRNTLPNTKKASSFPAENLIEYYEKLDAYKDNSALIAKLKTLLLGDVDTEPKLVIGGELGYAEFRWVKKVVAIPYLPESIPDKDRLWLFCDKPQERSLEAAPAPTLLVGFPDVTYPQEMEHVPLRIGLPNIMEEKITGIPIQGRGLTMGMPESNRLGMPYGNKDDATTIFLLQEQKYTAVGKLTALSAEAETETGNGGGLFSMTFYDNAYQHFKEGQTYTLYIPFGEYDGENFVEGSCEGYATLLVKIVPEYLTWQGTNTVTGDKAEAWYNDENWKQSTRGELYIDSDGTDGTTDANGDDDVTDAFAPLHFTRITIPEGQTLGLEDLKEDKHLLQGIDTTSKTKATQYIQYDMAVDKKGDNTIVTPYYINKVKAIYFKPEAKLRRQQFLTYDTARVEFEMTPNAKYWMASPLQSVFAGDMYTVKNTGRQNTYAFADITYDTEKNNRQAPAFYQKAWDKAITMYVPESEVDPADPNPGVVPNPIFPQGDLTPKYYEVVQSNWSREYNDVNVPYALGKGFYASVEKKNATNLGEKVLVRLPKADKSYSYEPLTKTAPPTLANRTNSGKLADKERIEVVLADSDEKDSWWNGETVIADGDGTHFLLGNPYMYPLDIAKFLEANDTVLAEKYWTLDTKNGEGLVVGTPDVKWEGGNITDATSEAVIAPMQAFFVELKGTEDATQTKAEGTTTGADLKIVHFDTSMMQGEETANASLRTATAKNPVLRLTAERGSYRSTALLTQRDGATNDYDADKDAVILLDTELKEIPQVYTIAGTRAVGVNVARRIDQIPLGVYAGEGKGEVTLTIEGIGDWAETLYLYDADTRKSVELTGDSYTLRLDGSSHGRYFLNAGSPTGNERIDNAESISIYSAVSGRVVASASEALKRIQVFTPMGRLVRTLYPARPTYTFDLPAGIYIIRAEIAHDQKTVKLRVQ